MWYWALISFIRLSRFWKGRWPENHQLCVSCGPRAVRAELVCPAGWAQLSPVMGSEGTFWSLLCACLTGYLLFPIYTQHLLAGDGGHLFLRFVFPPRPFLCWGLYSKGSARPRLFLLQQLCICLVRQKAKLGPDGSPGAIYLFWPCVSQIAFSSLRVSGERSLFRADVGKLVKG